jgi:hydroxymethylpyrimidine/phosphomethylpyrimidine kinase
VDVLGQADGSRQPWHSARIATHNGHGTGCTLSSAIAVYLAQGLALPEAVGRARDYIRGAIQAGASVHTGQGQGPLNHGFAPLPMQVISN